MGRLLLVMASVLEDSLEKEGDKIKQPPSVS
jgi:hypothetical protein